MDLNQDFSDVKIYAFSIRPGYLPEAGYHLYDLMAALPQSKNQELTYKSNYLLVLPFHKIFWDPPPKSYTFMKFPFNIAQAKHEKVAF